MKKITNILIIISFCTICVLDSYGQKINNWEANVHFSTATDYDFDLNKPIGMPIRMYWSFKINIGYTGTGKLYQLNNSNGQKLIMDIEDAKYSQYSNGDQYVSINCHNEYGKFAVRVNIKNKRKKTIIKKISIINSSNGGTVYY